jgi:integrase
MCNGHYKRWAGAGHPDPAVFAAAEAGRAWRGHRPLTGCQVTGCEFGVMRRQLCSRHALAWRRAGEPAATAAWAASVQPAVARPGQDACLIARCELWAEPGWPFCMGHLRRWKRNGRPDMAGFVRSCGEPAGDAGQADLTVLPRQLRLEVQYALQCRSDDKTVTNRPAVVSMTVRRLADSGAGSLLDLAEREWHNTSASAIRALITYAHRKVTTLAEGEGWENEYPRDTWRLDRIGVRDGSAQSILQFGRIPQPWLRNLAKRWTRWRLSTGLSVSASYAGVMALTRLAAFLQEAGIDDPGRLDRETLERYLPELHRAFGERHTYGQDIGQLSVFLREARRHQWEPPLPPSAMIFPEDHPRRPQALPRFLAEHIMVQVEDPANLARFGNPAYRLITLILIRCGLRITPATSVSFGCLVHDADGAPYLRYYNKKMKREALVPLDDELEQAIRDQQARAREGRPGPPPVLFPRPFANIDGRIPIRSDTYRDALYRWLENCDVRDEHGQPAHLTPHQWRHTLGTRLINRDVPQHVVQKILDHDSPEMTAHYARLSDETIRGHWEKARKVGATGQPVRISPDGPLGDAAWAKQQISRATQSLPNGYCQLPLVKTCPHANSCLTCPMFVTTPDFLQQHHAQRKATLQIITAAEAAGHARVAEMNKQVIGNLDKIITALETGGQQQEEAASAP